MSRALKKIEEIANEKLITDHKEIGEILNELLAKEYRVLRGKKDPAVDFLADDMAKGFVISRNKIRACNVREILMLIGCEPGAPWFEIGEDEVWRTDQKLSKDFFAAAHSFVFAGTLLGAKSFDPTVKRFMKISYRELIAYLEAGVKTDMEHDVFRKRNWMQLDRIRFRTEKFVRDCDRKEHGDDDPITVGDILALAYARGTNSWMCGFEPLGFYVEKIATAYSVINQLLMDCIRVMAIDTDFSEISALFERCAESGKYELIAELAYDRCFKSLGEQREKTAV